MSPALFLTFLGTSSTSQVLYSHHFRSSALGSRCRHSQALRGTGTPERHTWSEPKLGPKDLTRWHMAPPPHAVPLSLPGLPSLSPPQCKKGGSPGPRGLGCS